MRIRDAEPALPQRALVVLPRPEPPAQAHRVAAQAHPAQPRLAPLARVVEPEHPAVAAEPAIRRSPR